ncbi:MAG: 6,7-dimethyl-8-ribityllumazine synthase [Betaproteobacteria bacterium]|nr:MAG: 6,7-dimethyl-8-ribityllumazine synthase [Betaproteobacteria bacterium]
MQRTQPENVRRTARYDGIVELEPGFDGAGLRVGIVMARFNLDICEGLLSSCTDELLKLGVARGDIRIITVPGALEIPLVLQTMGRSGKYDALVALGAVIRGETYHFELVSNEMGAGVTRVGLDTGVPIANGVLTTEDEDQAVARMREKGADCARAAVEMANLLKALK